MIEEAPSEPSDMPPAESASQARGVLQYNIGEICAWLEEVEWYHLNTMTKNVSYLEDVFLSPNVCNVSSALQASFLLRQISAHRDDSGQKRDPWAAVFVRFCDFCAVARPINLLKDNPPNHHSPTAPAPASVSIRIHAWDCQSSQFQVQV